MFGLGFYQHPRFNYSLLLPLLTTLLFNICGCKPTPSDLQTPAAVPSSPTPKQSPSILPPPQTPEYGLNTLSAALVASATSIPQEEPKDITVTQPSFTLTPRDQISPKLTSILGSILSNPEDFAGKVVEIVGYYRGWFLLDETNSAPPMTRSDWVIADLSGAIYVHSLGGFDHNLGLDPNDRNDNQTILRLVGTVQLGRKEYPYIEPSSVKIVKLVSPMP
jgi:hypothetical protein